MVHELCRLRFYVSPDVARLFINNVYSGKPYPFPDDVSNTPHMWNHVLGEIGELEPGPSCLYIPVGHVELLVTMPLS
jgi:hypothetical protein